jgi:PAS domain S-box-containing protein
MKFQSKRQNAKDGGKRSVHQSKPVRTKRVRSLAPKQFIEIMEHMNDGLVVLDKDWHYVYVNQKAAVILQREKPSDLVGKHIWTEFPEGIGQPFQLAYEKAMRDQVPIVFEDHYEPWDLWFENRIYPSSDSLLILFTEITDRKRIERLLNERQYFLQKILDTEPGTVYIYDLEERRNVYVNRHWLNAFGYTEKETQALGDQLLPYIIHPDDLERISIHHDNWRQSSEGDIREIEYRIRAKTGEWCWLHSHEAAFVRDEMGTVKQILGISYEITPRKLAQEALRQSEQQLELIYDSVADIIFLLSVEPGDRYRFISINKAFLRATGLRNDQIINRYAEEIIPAASHPMVFGNYKRAIQERIQMTWEEVSDFPAGRKTAIVTINAVYNEANICTHLVGVIHDITERKQAEQALRESEEKFSKVFHASPIPLSISRMSDGRYVEVNESFLRRLGYQREEVIGQDAASMGVWANSEDRQNMISLLSEKGSLRNFESQFRTKSGEIGTALLFRDVIELGGEKYLIGTSLDITERKQAEEELRLSETRYRTVVENQSEFIVRWKPDGTLTFVNEAYCRYFGVTPEQVVSSNFMPLIVEEDREAVEVKLSRLISGAVPAATDVHRVIKADGSVGWQEWVDQATYDEAGGIIEFQSVGRDITERKQMEKAVLEERDFSDAMLNSLPGVFYFYDQTGKFLRWNRNLEIISGYSGEEISRMHPLDFFAGKDKEHIAQRIQEVFENGASTAEANFIIKSGESIPYYYTGKRIEIESQPYLIGMGIDITQRRVAEQELRKLNLELEERIATRTKELAAAMIKAVESDRLKSAFLATMSHELRTPLNSIIGFTGVILQGLAGPLNEEQTKQLNMMRDSARHLLALINDVLDISKIEAGQLEIIKRPFDMRQAIESALRVVQPLAHKKNLELVMSVGPGVGLLNNDRRRVEQVLINLLNNAIKFTEHGTVKIDCQVREGWIETNVRDEGIGIKPEDLGRLFKPFQQIDTGLARRHEGTGLGLSICQRLVSAMGGAIEVESQWGVGSTFKFTLPEQELLWQRS